MKKLFEDISTFLEGNKGQDHISMTIPLFIRCLEFAREDAKRDIDLHKFTENIIKMDKTLTSDDYDKLFADLDTERK